MRGTVPTSEWASFVSKEYLAEYLPAGGSSVKFPVPMNEQSRRALFERLKSFEADHSVLTFFVDARETKVHMTDQVFFKIAEQVDWPSLARSILVRLLKEDSYRIPGELGPQPYLSIAEENDLPPEMLLGALRKALGAKVFRKRSLAKDFRVAMTKLCEAVGTGGAEGTTTIEKIEDWLTGANKSVSAVKPYQIFNRISRHNSRHFLESLFRWVVFAGYEGSVVVLDIGRLSLKTNPKDGYHFYTKSALLDAYEVLRQFIDSSHRLPSALLVVVPGVDFLDDDPLSRGMGAYEALKFRVYDEVRDRELVNPFMSLVRLDDQPKPDP